MVVAGFFMVFANNGLNAWAIQYIPTNESALLNGTAAFWIAGLGVFGPRGHPLTRWAILGLSIGFAGTVLMLVSKEELRASSILAELGVLGACLAFSLGTLYYRSIDTQVSSLMFMAWRFLHEHLSRVQLIGMVIIIVGVSILTLPGGSVTDPKTLGEPKAQ